MVTAAQRDLAALSTLSSPAYRTASAAAATLWSDGRIFYYHMKACKGGAY